MPACSVADLPYQHLTVIGCGLIGGSWLMAAHASCPGLSIHAVDTHPETLQYLIKAGVVHTVHRQLPKQWASNHLIVIATHLNNSLAILRELAPWVAQDASITVTDIGSCKRAVVALGQELLPEQFVGGHPLAGKEVSGVDHATPLLFAAKPYVLCPHHPPDTHPHYAQRVETLKTFIGQTLQAQVGFQDVETHDKAMAFVSHLPQLYAVILTQLLAHNRPGELLAFHGAGMDSQLRLAASPYAMWHDIMAHNADHLRTVVQQCQHTLGELDAQLATLQQAAPTEENPTLAHWFDVANSIHKRFHQAKGHGSATAASAFPKG